MPLSIRDNYLEYPYYPHDDPSSHDTSQSTDEDFDFDDYVNLEPEQQPINMDPNSPGIDVSRSATLERLERGTQASRQENTPQSTLSQPHSPVTQSSSNNGVLDDMQIDNEQKDEQGGNENGGSGDVFEALSSIERVRIQISQPFPRDFTRRISKDDEVSSLKKSLLLLETLLRVSWLGYLPLAAERNRVPKRHSLQTSMLTTTTSHSVTPSQQETRTPSP